MRKKSSRYFASIMVLILLISIIPITVNAAGTIAHVSTEAELRSAIGSDDFCIVVLDNDITLSSTGGIVNGAKFYTIMKSGTIDGNGHTIKAAVTGTDDLGVSNSSASNYNIFRFDFGTVNLKNITIKGGSISAISNSFGNLTMDNVTVTCSGSASSSAGGIYNNSGNIILNNCSISRNVAQYGGGFINGRGKMIFNNCSVTENRSIGSGSCQNDAGATLYINNSTFANNQSSGIGGAISNNNGSTLYVTNSTICGNISTDSVDGAKCGGGIGNNDGDLYCANSLIANNYATKPDGTYINSDIGFFNGTNVNMYYCMVGAYIGTANGGTGTLTNDIGNKIISSDNVFSAYANCFVMKADGVKDDTVNSPLLSKKRPILVKKTVSNVPQFVAPLSSSYSTNYSSAGVDTYLYYKSDFSTVQMGYNDGTIKPLTPSGTDLATNKVATYQDGTTRSPNIVGAYGKATYTDINAGNVTKDSEISTNAPVTSISTSIDALKAAVLSSDELTQVSNGNNIEILLKVDDAGSTVSQTDKNLVSGNLGSYTVGQYLDLSLWKIINSTQTQMTSINSPITVTFEIPSALKNSNSSVQRKYKVMRIHDGAVTILDDLDTSNDTITISTDKFSTYVIVYDDTVPTTNTAKTADHNTVKTADQSPIIYMTVVAIASGVGLTVIIKRKKFLLIK